MSRRWILALLIVWMAVRLVWYVPLLLGVQQPSPAALTLIMAVLDVLVFIVVVAHLIRSAVAPRSDGSE
ncbi:MAG: hypothetical protein R6V07_19995 [Armatimonadota bacterium]